MDNETKQYIDDKFSEAEAKSASKQIEALNMLKKRQALIKRFVFICTLILLGLLGFMIAILWKYQIAPRI